MTHLAIIANAESVPAWITILFSLLLVSLVLCLAFEEKLHAKKSIIAGAFAVICLFLGTLTQILEFENVVVGSHQAVNTSSVELKYNLHENDPLTETIVIPPANAGETSGESGSQEHGDKGATDGNQNEQASGAGADPIAAQSNDAKVGDHDDHSAKEEYPTIHIGGHRLKMPTYIPGIDWSVIAIILGSSLFVDVTSRSGLFSWIAIKVTKLSRGDPLRLLFFYGIMTVIFSAVLNNVTAMIIIGSLTVVSLEKLERRHQLLSFLLIEGLLTNVGGLLTLISSVPNIIVGTTANINFATFLLKAMPYVVIATGVTLWMGAAIFKIRGIKGEAEKLHARDMVAGFDENDGIESWTFFKVAIVMLGIFIVLIAGTSALPVINELGMGFVALSMAAIMLLLFRSEVDRFYKAVDWDLIGFFMALFVVIYVMEHAQVLHYIGLALQSVLIGDLKAESANFLDSATLLIGSAAFSSVTDNIPLAAMLASILHDLGAPGASGLWWSVIFGANLGGNITPIGSASTLVAVTIMHKHKVPMSFAGFVKMAIVFAAVQILLATLYVIFIIPLIPAV